MSAPTLDRPAILDDTLLAACLERAPIYDRENRFFQEDWDAIRQTGMLTINVPRDLGGLGLSMTETCKELARLAYNAPATALAVNMHLYWTGIAAEMRKRGDASLEWMLREAVAGEVFAAGHAETGNDLPVFLSTAKAERVQGGYRITGHKMFGSLTPVWTRFGVHAMDTTSDPEHPTIIHAMIPRGSAGVSIKETWDTMGMRATKSDDTILEAVYVPDKYIQRVLPAGQADLFILCLFAVALGGLASVYLSAAHRAMDLAVASARKRTSLALSRPMAYHPEVQHHVAQMALRLEAMDAQLDRMLADWDGGVDHGEHWPLKIVAVKENIAEGTKAVVDHAMTISGGGGMYKGNEIERLYRDIRCAGFHPANSLLAHEIVGKIALGIDLGEQPRWG